MNELKVYHCNEWHNEYTEFYLKHEADKVIAEKDKELRHHKYKRCRANAKRCRDLWVLFRYFGKGGNPVFYWRWWNIWLEIADKFKEAK